jgi:hypothetical protein
LISAPSAAPKKRATARVLRQTTARRSILLPPCAHSRYDRFLWGVVLPSFGQLRWGLKRIT